MDTNITATIDTTPKKGEKITRTFGAKQSEQSTAFRTSISSASDMNKDKQPKSTPEKKQ